MIEQSDKQLIEWVKTVLGAVSVSLAPPERQPSGAQVNLYLLSLAAQPPPRTAQRPPLQIGLRYLVTTWAEKPEEAHRMLGELVFGALDNAGFGVDLAELPVALWSAFGIAPRPAFILSLPVRREKPMPQTPLVRQPLIIQATLISVAHGRVYGPNNLPLPDAQVVIPALHLSATTDGDGAFRFPNLPHSPAPRSLIVTAKGRSQPVTLTFPPDGAPVVIHFDFAEV